MSHRSKSGQVQTRRRRQQKIKRRLKRKRAALIAEGKIQKGQAPAPSAQPA